jgi:hypothetical protein
MTLEAPAIVVAWQDTDTQVASLWQDLLYSTATDDLGGPGYTGTVCITDCLEPTTFSSGNFDGSSSNTASIFERAGVRAGVGVGITAIVLLIGALLALCFRRKKKAMQAKSEGDESSRDEEGQMSGGMQNNTQKVPVIVTTEAPDPNAPSVPVKDSTIAPLPQGSPQTNAFQDTGSRELSNAPQEMESSVPKSVPSPDSSVEPSTTQSGPPAAGAPIVTDVQTSPVQPPAVDESATTNSLLNPEQSTSSDHAVERNDRLSRLQTLEEQAALLQRAIAAERARVG